MTFFFQNKITGDNRYNLLWKYYKFLRSLKFQKIGFVQVFSLITQISIYIMLMCSIIAVVCGGAEKFQSVGPR